MAPHFFNFHKPTVEITTATVEKVTKALYHQ